MQVQMDADTLIRRAELLMERRRYDAALKELFAALALEPENTDAFENLCWCYYRQNMREEAAQWAQKIIHALPDYYGGHYYLAICHGAMGRLDAAKNSLQQALHCNPHWAPLYGYKAELLIIEDEWELAEKAARAGLEIDPDNAYCLQKLNAALTKLKSKRKLKESLKIALEQHPDDASTHISVGWSLLETGKVKQARVHFETALAKNPEDVLAREGMLEAVKAKNLLYRALLRFDFSIGSQTYESRRAFMLVFTVFLVCAGTYLTDVSRWWVLLLVPAAVALQMMWLVKLLGNAVIYFFSKKYKHLVPQILPGFSTLINHGFSISFFILTLNFFRPADVYNGPLVMFSAFVFLVTFFWRRYYLHAQNSTNKNAKVFTIVLSGIALAFVAAFAVSGDFGWFTGLFFMGVVYALASDKILAMKLFN